MEPVRLAATLGRSWRSRHFHQVATGRGSGLSLAAERTVATPLVAEALHRTRPHAHLSASGAIGWTGPA